MFRLEVENFGEWELIDEFRNINLARIDGEIRFPQNHWRVSGKEGEVYSHDPFDTVIAELGEQDLERFERSRLWSEGAIQRARSREQRRQRRRQRMDTALADWVEFLDIRSSNFEKVDWRREGF